MMRMSKLLAAFGIAALCTYVFSGPAVRNNPDDIKVEGEKILVEKNSIIQTNSDVLYAEDLPPASHAMLPEELAVEEDLPLLIMEEDIRETTIEGGLTIKNETSYQIDMEQIMSDGPAIKLASEGPQILIMHTHGSEAYTQAGLDRYESSDSNRTGDTEFNIVRVGDELSNLLSAAGLNVIHDREIYDYPSYTGSYNRSGAAVEKYLAEYPGISMVIDVHRDALGANGVIYKTMAEEDGVCASQIMLLVGSDASGLEHPGWKSNLSLALYLQEAVNMRHPTLMRPVSLVKERYNQHLTPGSVILEVGSSGNTLQEALAAIRLFADAAAPALLALTEVNDQG